ncbi:MAG: sulfur carrier protein ThiS [Pseudanabaena sp. ELA607]|jgi:sulfur carrier protein
MESSPALSPMLPNSTSTTIKIFLNGTEKDCPANLVMTAFLEAMGLNPRLLAVEYNGEILHRQFWSEIIVQDGDHLEIVTIVGGG